jgi:hypothetical protein
MSDGLEPETRRIDSVVPRQPLDVDVMKEDLQFLLRKFRQPLVGWHDPNFGVPFNDYMDAIEACGSSRQHRRHRRKQSVVAAYKRAPAAATNQNSRAVRSIAADAWN